MHYKRLPLTCLYMFNEWWKELINTANPGSYFVAHSLQETFIQHSNRLSVAPLSIWEWLNNILSFWISESWLFRFKNKKSNSAIRLSTNLVDWLAALPSIVKKLRCKYCLLGSWRGRPHWYVNLSFLGFLWPKDCRRFRIPYRAQLHTHFSMNITHFPWSKVNTLSKKL